MATPVKEAGHCRQASENGFAEMEPWRREIGRPESHAAKSRITGPGKSEGREKAHGREQRIDCAGGGRWYRRRPEVAGHIGGR